MDLLHVLSGLDREASLTMDLLHVFRPHLFPSDENYNLDTFNPNE